MRYKWKFVKGILIFLLISMIVMTLSGCQPKLTAKETLDKIFSQSLVMKDYNADFEGAMSMTFDGDIEPEAMQFMQMFQNIKYNGSMQVVSTEELGEMGMQFTVDMNGMSMALEGYFDGNQIIVKYPLLPQYIVLNLQDAMSQLEETEGLPSVVTYEGIMSDIKTLSTTWLPGYYAKMVEAIDENALELLDSHEFVIGGETIKSKALKLTFTPEMMITLLEVAMDQAVADQTLYNILKKYDEYDEIGTFEEFKTTLQEGKGELLSALDLEEIQNSLSQMSYSYIMGYDKTFKPILVDMTVSMEVHDEWTEMTSKIDMTGVYKFDYTKKAIAFPEITPENSMDLMEQFGPMLFGMGDYDYSSEDYDYDYDYSDDSYNYYLDDQVYYVEELVWYLEDDYDESQIEDRIQDFLNFLPFETAYVYYASSEGNMLIWPETELPADYDPRDRPFYQDALVDDYVVAEIYNDLQTGRDIQSISKKVMVNGNVVGVVGIDFYVD